eukprot:2220424-Prymnesium_polylepis.1
MDALHADLPRRVPKVWLPSETDQHENIAQLDASAVQKIPELEHAWTATQLPQHGRLVRHRLPTIARDDPQECGMRLCGDAVDCLAKWSIQTTVASRSQRHFDFVVLRDWQHCADSAESCKQRPASGAKRRQMYPLIRCTHIVRENSGCNDGVRSKRRLPPIECTDNVIPVELTSALLGSLGTPLSSGT